MMPIKMKNFVTRVLKETAAGIKSKSRQQMGRK